MVLNVDTAYKNSKMATLTREITKMISFKEKVMNFNYLQAIISGIMDQVIKDSLKTVSEMDSAYGNHL